MLNKREIFFLQFPIIFYSLNYILQIPAHLYHTSKHSWLRTSSLWHHSGISYPPHVFTSNFADKRCSAKHASPGNVFVPPQPFSLPFDATFILLDRTHTYRSISICPMYVLCSDNYPHCLRTLPNTMELSLSGLIVHRGIVMETEFESSQNSLMYRT